MDQIKAQYSSVASNVDAAEKVLRHHVDILQSDVKNYDEMYAINLDFYKKLTMYLAAGKQRIEELRSNDLVELINKANESKSQLDSQKSVDLAEAINRFEKKLYCLEVSRQLVIQQACQIRQAQKSSTSLCEEIISLIYNGIPAWKNQICIQLKINNAKEASSAIDATSKFINDMFIKSADDLQEVSIKTAERSYETTVSIDTINYINDSYITTLEKILDINKDGMNKIRENSQQIAQIEERRRIALMDFSDSVQKTALENATNPLIENGNEPVKLELKF